LATMASLDAVGPVSTGSAAFPRMYLVWLAGAQASVVGDAALYFALGWAATAHGGRTGALVLTAITVHAPCCCCSGVRWPTGSAPAE
jgi:hypothetical protein